jgi:hypothetical protein
MDKESLLGHPNQVKQVPRGTCVEPSTTPIVPHYAIPDDCRESSAMDEDSTFPHIPPPAPPISGEVRMDDGPTSSAVLPSVISATSTSPHPNDIAMDYSTSCTAAMGSPLRSSSSIPQPPTTPPPSKSRTSSRPLPLPPVPTALADIIGKAVADHLSSGLVELTIREIVEACVSHLAEIMETRFTTQNPLHSTEGGSCPKSKNCSADPSDCHGSDGDDEEEEAVLPPRWKKPGPQGKQIVCM